MNTSGLFSFPDMRANKRFLASVFVVAVVARLLWSWLAYHPPFVSPRDTMSVMYVRSACLTALGLGYGQVLPGSPAHKTLNREVVVPMTEGGFTDWNTGERIAREGLYPETLHPPGTSLVAAALWRITGLDAWKCLQVFGAFYDAFGVLLIFLLVRELGAAAPEDSGGVDFSSVARVGSVVYALFPPLLAAVASARAIGFMMVPCMAAVLFYAYYWRTRRIKWLLGSAAIAGVASYFRPDALLLTSFCCLAHTAEVWRRFSLREVAAYVLRPLVALLVCLAVLSPWAMRNQRTIGKFVFTSTGSGCTLVTGLGTYPNPWGFGRSDIDRDREARAAGYKHAFVPDADEFFRKRFFEAVKSNPLAYLKILIRRTLMPLAPPYSWNLRLRGDVSWGKMRASGASPLRALPYLLKSYWPELLSSVFSFLGLLGMIWFGFYSRWNALAWIVLFLPYLYVTATHVVTHMAPYYLLPAVSCQIIGFAWLAVRFSDIALWNRYVRFFRESRNQ